MTWSDNQADLTQALHVDWVSDGQRGKLLSHVRHPGLAWCRESVDPTDQNLQAAALGYLEALWALQPELDELKPALDELRSALAVKGEALDTRRGLIWLPLTWGGPKQAPDGAEPDESFLVGRQPGANWTEATLVLVAARRIHQRPVGDGVGLRVTAHVTCQAGGSNWSLRFASLACSRIDRAARALPDALARWADPQRAQTLRDQLGQAMQVEHVAIQGMHEGPLPHVLEVDGLAVRVQVESGASPQDRAAKRRRKGRARVYGFTAILDTLQDQVVSQHLRPMAAGMGEVRLFERDGASVGPPDALGRRRPDGIDDEVDALREVQVAVPRQTVGAGPVPLRQAGRFEVTHDTRVRPRGRKGRLVRPPPAVWPTIRPDALPLRSDDLAAAQAYLRGKSWFDRLDAYGFDLDMLFRHARLPLMLRPRARLPGAADGRAVNAEVRPYYAGTVPEADALSEAMVSRYDFNKRPQLQVRFGAADVHLRRGEQHLGLAADPRWAWHEFGHVLNFAATGELEFGFAHSAGDALAAIAADPDSGLSADARLRGFTFPWAFAPRRHDRGAGLGWCWCGRRSGQRLLARPTLSHHRHGYFEEQLLSSSLFRLYLSLGGDTGHMPSDGERTLDESRLTKRERRALACRRSASDYSVYLIMRAIALLGSNRVVPTATAELFVGALVDADLGTGLWKVVANWPYRNHALRTVRRQGGRVHKVIRWAFQQQGLYPADPLAVAEGVGLPPRGDLYIADGRAEAGGYEPVPLVWDGEKQPLWQAHPGALSADPQGRIHVHVQRLDDHPCTGLQLRLWVRANLHAGQWMALEPVAGPDGLHFSAALPVELRGQRPWVLACVDSDADRSNLPRVAGIRPPRRPSDLIELVAHDNNIALTRLAD